MHAHILISSLACFLSRLLGRMSVRGLDPTCPTSIKREPSSPTPSSQGDVSPAQPSPESSSSDTNSSYGPLKGLGHGNGLDSPGLQGHTAGLANNGGATRLIYDLRCDFMRRFSTFSLNFLHLCPGGLGRKKAR